MRILLGPQSYFCLAPKFHHLTAPMRTSLLLTFLAAYLQANAVTVYIYANVQPLCSIATGSLSAYASGGVGPYTYLWSPGGETTADINGLLPGTYSVTVTDLNSDQATDQIDLTAQGYALTTSAINHSGLCNGSWTVSFSPNGGPFIFGPPPYYVDGQMMEVTPDGVYFKHFESPESQFYGQFVPLPFEDGNGCTGTMSAYCGWPLELPEVTVLDVQGSCSGGNNGSITYSVGEEGHQQEVDYGVDYPDGTRSGSGTLTQTATGLASGDHWIILRGGAYITQSGFGCYDSLLVNVPDLGNSCGNVSGNVYMDYDADCTAQAGETRVPGALLEVLPGPYYAFSNSHGNYSLNLPIGNFTVQQLGSTVAEHCFGAPIPFNITGIITGVDLADTSLVALDAKITGEHSPARPGFPFMLGLRLTNLTPAATGNTSTVFTFDPAFSFVSSEPAGTVVGNTITWDQNSLGAFEQRYLTVYLQVAPDINLLGTTLVNTATVTTANTDADPTNNTVQLPVTITGAYDPNEKVATTSTRSSTDLYYLDLDEWVDYTIRFQNTGTDTAFNVVITDTIPLELDLGTLELGASSHVDSVSITEGHVLRWAFDNIQLPDSNVNELKSHGFVSFRIRPRLPLTAGTAISNTANIFFDFNPPVITDPSVLTAEFSTGITGRSLPEGLLLSPVPVRDVLHFTSTQELIRVKVVATDGRLVLQQPVQGKSGDLHISGLKAGMYVLIGSHGDGSTTRQRFVKE